MSYDVKAKHGEIIASLKAQYEAYFNARIKYWNAERAWERERRERNPKEKEGFEAIQEIWDGCALDVIREHNRDFREKKAWESESAERKAWDEAGEKLHATVLRVTEHYPHWHNSRIRSASGIDRCEWELLKTNLCLSVYTSMQNHSDDDLTDYGKACVLADDFTEEELRNMTYKQYTEEREARARKLLKMKEAVEPKYTLPDDCLDVHALGYHFGLDVLVESFFNHPNNFAVLPTSSFGIEKAAQLAADISLTRGPDEAPTTNSSNLFSEYFIPSFIEGYRFCLYAANQGLMDLLHNISKDEREYVLKTFALELAFKESFLGDDDSTHIVCVVDQLKAMHGEYQAQVVR